ncbi:MAG: hypothetical protein GY936_02155 [Ignavibacteriae bacterium]|nr:hypothetical protein [Ignavibacteriota bacterium]
MRNIKSNNRLWLKRVYLVLFIISLIIITNCSENNLIEKETLAKAYVDILVVEEYYQNIDSLRIEKEKVFQKYSIDQESYDLEIKSFSSNQESWDEFFKLANTYLDTLKANIKVPNSKIKKL